MADTITGKLLAEQRERTITILERNKDLSEAEKTLIIGQGLILEVLRTDHKAIQDLEKTVKNGLTHKVTELHDKMLATDDKKHEINILGIKMSYELRNGIIQGLISAGAVIAAVLLGK